MGKLAREKNSSLRETIDRGTGDNTQVRLSAFFDSDKYSLTNFVSTLFHLKYDDCVFCFSYAQ